MKTIRIFIFWIRLGVTLIGVIFDAISYVQIFKSSNPFNDISNLGFIAVVNGVVIIFLLWWIAEKEWADFQIKWLKPILRVGRFGCEEKPIYKTFYDAYGVAQAHTTTIYDTLYIQVFNAQKYKDAKKVWANVEWLDMNGSVLLSHQGRWHIANPENETKPENLQYVDLDSNGHPEKLHFACINKSKGDKFFYGLAREDISKESWDKPKYKLDKELYVVRITLRGNNDVKQEFKYIVSNNNGNLLLSSGDLWNLGKVIEEKD
jgi:hypothetical protein